MMSNKGLNSNEALEESTATNSSVTLSGIRREKEAMIALGIKDYTTDRRQSTRIPSIVSRLLPAALDRHLVATPAMSQFPTAPLNLPRCPRSLLPLQLYLLCLARRSLGEGGSLIPSAPFSLGPLWR